MDTVNNSNTTPPNPASSNAAQNTEEENWTPDTSWETLFAKFPELRAKRKRAIKTGVIVGVCIEILGFILGDPVFALPCAFVFGLWTYGLMRHFCLPKHIRKKFFTGSEFREPSESTLSFSLRYATRAGNIHNPANRHH